MNIPELAIKSIKEQNKFLPAVNYKNVTLMSQQGNSCDECITQTQVSSVSAKFLKTLFPNEKIALKSFVTCRENGKNIPVYITKFEKQDKIYFYLKDEQADKLGYATLSYPSGGVFKVPMGKDYIYNSMELVALESKNQARKFSPYRGIGTELLKAAVKESKAKGFGGRIHLMAYDKNSPVLFYYKNGLRFTSSEKDVLMQKFLSTPAAQRGELPPDLQSGLMYLPEENIEKLLAM